MAIGAATANNAGVATLQCRSPAQRRGALSSGNLPPQVTIVRPLGNRAQSQQALTLAARAWDTEDGNLGASIQWTRTGRHARLRCPAQRLYGLHRRRNPHRDGDRLGRPRYSQSITVTFQSLVITDGAIWHDPAQPGRFLSFNKNIFNDWVATWFAYEGANPIWYLSNVVPVSANKALSTPS